MDLNKLYELAFSLNRNELFSSDNMEVTIKLPHQTANELEYQLSLKVSGVINKTDFKPTKTKEFSISLNGITFNIIKIKK